MKLLLISTLLLFFSVSNFAQNRSEKPFQVQLNFSGLVLNGIAEDLRRRDVLSLEVNDYTMPGLSIGYHVTSKFYLGYSYHPNRNYVLKEEYSFEGSTEDILINLDHNSGTFHTLEGRFTPFGFGLYVSGFFTHVSEAQYKLTGQPINDFFEVGSNIYSDAVSAEWNFRDITTFGLGIGFNQVFGNGLSLNVGAGLPVTFAKDLYEDVQVIQEDTEFTAEDIQIIQDRIEGDNFYVPVQFYASLGWNF